MPWVWKFFYDYASIERYFFYRGKSAPILMSKKGGVTPWICPGGGGLFVTSKNTLYNRPSYNFFYTCFRRCFYYLKHWINLPDPYSCKKCRRITKNSMLTSKTLKLWIDLIKVCAKVPSVWRVKKCNKGGCRGYFHSLRKAPPSRAYSWANLPYLHIKFCRGQKNSAL